MGNLADDHIAAVELIIDEYQRLQTHNPHHDLLKYITDVTKEGFGYSPDKAIRQKFVDLYAPTDEIPVAVMLTRYLTDLVRAVDQIEGTDRLAKPKPQEPDKVTQIRTIDNFTDDDIPF